MSLIQKFKIITENTDLTEAFNKLVNDVLKTFNIAYDTKNC